ncbi:Copine-6 [Seminavis robusta]|uniref:Copine-6 n=1 Tax=Seminavis robusta TaxID=568900 RepID=A0A9N8EGG1_9STRA|nr:Copine-6 [Seminavis robusta]|eukprot:Sro955_g224440.1 Copine-6 (277) ;mRNA; r:16611-17794
MTKYQLSLHADRLRKGFLWRRPMAYAVVMVENESKTLGKTEVAQPGTRAEWRKPMTLEFSSDMHVPFTVALHDSRNDDRLMAKADFEASEVFNSRGHMQMKEDRNGTQIYADLHEAIQGPHQGYIRLQLRGLDIKNVEPGLLGLGRSDPFFEISKKNSDHAAGIVRWNSVYRSEEICDHLNPFWEPFSIGLEELCYCNLDWPLKIAVWDYENDGDHRVIGEVEVTAQKLIDEVAVKGNADRERAFDLIRDGDKTKLKGVLCVLTADLTLENEAMAA